MNLRVAATTTPNGDFRMAEREMLLLAIVFDLSYCSTMSMLHLKVLTGTQQSAISPARQQAHLWTGTMLRIRDLITIVTFRVFTS